MTDDSLPCSFTTSPIVFSSRVTKLLVALDYLQLLRKRPAAASTTSNCAKKTSPPANSKSWPARQSSI